MNPLIYKMVKAEQELSKNFKVGDKIYLVNCPKCHKENWSGAVTSGVCCWCEYDANSKGGEDDVD